MISYIKGILTQVSDGMAVIEAGGIGYGVFVSPSTISALGNLGDEVKIYTYMNVKEDGISLFGFYTKEEQSLFNLLISISGIGPKIALGVLDRLPPKALVSAIVTGDVKAFEKAPGIGKKTAQRIILELKDKFKNADFLDWPEASEIMPATDMTGAKAEATEALQALGYSLSEAVRAVMPVYEEGMAAEKIIKLALKRMVK